ncbi:MAG TPA: hypothetical protein VGB82_20505 [Alphaproteobacteria bacterium]
MRTSRGKNHALAVIGRICGIGICALLMAGGRAAQSNTVTIGNHKDFLVDGKSFYPVCLHHANAWQQAAEMGFNCVMGDGPRPAPESAAALKDKFLTMGESGVLNSFEYSDYVRSGASAGVDTIARDLSRLPAFLSYVIDEPQYSPNATLSVVKSAIATIKANDPHHPTFIMGDRDGNVRNGMNALPDVIGLDDYPVRWPGYQYGHPPTDNLENSIGAHVDANVSSVGPNVPVMFAAQAHSIPPDSAYPQSGRYPTPQELRAMAYLALNHGARGIFIYALDDNYSGFKGFAFAPTLLAYMPTLVAELKYMLAHYVEGAVAAANTASSVNAVTIKTHCRTTVVAVNPTGRSLIAQLPGLGTKTFAPLEVYWTHDGPSAC